MVKKTLVILFLFVFCYSCTTVPSRPPRPPFYLESLPQDIITELSLDDRIAIEEIWKQLRNRNGQKAIKKLHLIGALSPAYYIGLGYANILLNRYQTSEKHFKEGLKDYPDMILIHLGLAQLYLKTERENLAFAAYWEVLERNPTHSFANQEYEILKTKKTKEALDEGKYYLTLDNPERAKEAFFRGLYYTPNSKEAHLSLAEIYKGEDELQDALLHMEALKDLEPKNPEILRDYADTLFVLKQFEKSLAIYEEIQFIQPENEEVLSQIENIKNKLGIFDLPSQYQSIPSKPEISKEDVAALLAVKFKDILDTSRAKPPILTDISTSWASKFILKMTSIGLFEVYANHTFQPDRMVTRAEMAKILFRLTELLKDYGQRFVQQVPPDKIEVADVSSDNHYFRPIRQIVAYQIMELSLDNEFRPEYPVSGEEAHEMLDIILDLIR